MPLLCGNDVCGFCLTTAVDRGGQRAVSRRAHHPGRLEEGPPRRPRRDRGDAQEVAAVRDAQGRQRHGRPDRSAQVPGMLVADGRGRGRRVRSRHACGAADV